MCAALGCDSLETRGTPEAERVAARSPASATVGAPSSYGGTLLVSCTRHAAMTHCDATEARGRWRRPRPQGA
eukprot:5636317-Prymnesium_polylepis.1